MNTEHDLSPPDLTPGYPSKGERQGAAWAALWTKLDQVEYLDGVELARDVSEAYELAEATLLTLLSAAARFNLLEREHRSVQGRRGPRPRSFYRVNPQWKDVVGGKVCDGRPYAAEYAGTGRS